MLLILLMDFPSSIIQWIGQYFPPLDLLSLITHCIDQHFQLIDFHFPRHPMD
jgi:hypothetical protein